MQYGPNLNGNCLLYVLLVKVSAYGPEVAAKSDLAMKPNLRIVIDGVLRTLQL